MSMVTLLSQVMRSVALYSLSSVRVGLKSICADFVTRAPRSLFELKQLAFAKTSLAFAMVKDCASFGRWKYCASVPVIVAVIAYVV